MKKSLLALTLTAALFSCKKDIEQKSLEAKDITGMGYVKGTVQKQIITPNGFTGYQNTNVAAANVNITIRVATNGASGIYPNSNYASTESFSGTSDAQGNFSIPVKSNGTSNGVTASVFIEGFTGTKDTVINGTTKTGLLNGYIGTSQNLTVYKGQTTWFNGGSPYIFGSFVINNNNNPNTVAQGTAVITGSISQSFIRQATTINNGTVMPSSFSTTNVPVPDGTKVYYTFDTDPLTLSTKVYQTTTSAGNYTFNVTTVAVNTPGFGQNGTVWLSDLVDTRDTVKCTTIITGTVAAAETTATPFTTGKAGVYNGTGITSFQGSLFNNEVRNAVNLNYGSFQAN